MTPLVLCGDYLSWEIYRWEWVDSLTQSSSLLTVAEVRCTLVTDDIFPDDDDNIHALDTLDALATAVKFNPWGN
jgi:hypothetical protein